MSSKKDAQIQLDTETIDRVEALLSWMELSGASLEVRGWLAAYGQLPVDETIYLKSASRDAIPYATYTPGAPRRQAEAHIVNA